MGGSRRALRGASASRGLQGECSRAASRGRFKGGLQGGA